MHGVSEILGAQTEWVKGTEERALTVCVIARCARRLRGIFHRAIVDSAHGDTAVICHIDKAARAEEQCIYCKPGSVTRSKLVCVAP